MNYNIQVMRAVAALMVMLYHSIPFFEVAGGHWGPLKPWVGVGYIGVDLFFVISGFIIASTYSNDDTTLLAMAKFFERRTYRIYFGYWPVLLLSCFYYFFFVPVHLANFKPLDTVFLLSHRISDLVIGQAWSLSFELFFYFTFALLSLWVTKARLALVLVYCVAIVILNLYDPTLGKGFFFNPHLLELFAGMLLGQMNLDIFKSTSSLPLVIAAFAIFLVWFEIHSHNRLLQAALVGCSAILLVSIAELLRHKGLNRPTWLSTLGNSSYSLYLLHYLLLEIFINHIAHITWLKPALPMLFVLWLAIIVAISHLNYRFIERPLYRWACAAHPFRLGYREKSIVQDR